MQLNMEQIAHEMKVIADSGMEEILPSMALRI